MPNVPVNIQLIENGSRTTNITWQDGISPIPGNPPADSYQVSLLNNSRIDIFDVSTTSIFLDPLLPFTNYTITIVARNRIGFSNNSEPFSFVTNEECKFNIYFSVMHTIAQPCGRLGQSCVYSTSFRLLLMPN